MFDYKHYVPILRWKAGEHIALRQLYDADKEALTPVIEIPSDVISKALNKMSLTAFANLLLAQILECWGRGLAFIDLSNLSSRLSLAQVSDFIERFYEGSRKLGLTLVPVASLGHDSNYQRGRAGRATAAGNGLCLRLFREDLEFQGLPDHVNTWLTSHEVNPSEVDVVLDLRIVDSFDANFVGAYEKIPLVEKWRTLTIAGGSFPKDLRDLSVGEHELPRIEWHHWKHLVSLRPRRVPTFGDYATLHPFLQSSFSGMNMSASIRYTTDDYWVVMRGEGLLNEGGAGHAQYPANAELLMQRPEFCGREFSFGDDYIYERPIKKDKPGIPRNWVTAGVNHHLTFVVRQIASLFGPSERRKLSAGLDQGWLPLQDADIGAPGAYARARLKPRSR